MWFIVSCSICGNLLCSNRQQIQLPCSFIRRFSIVKMSFLLKLVQKQIIIHTITSFMMKLTLKWNGKNDWYNNLYKSIQSGKWDLLWIRYNSSTWIHLSLLNRRTCFFGAPCGVMHMCVHTHKNLTFSLAKKTVKKKPRRRRALPVLKFIIKLQ